MRDMRMQVGPGLTPYRSAYAARKRPRVRRRVMGDWRLGVSEDLVWADDARWRYAKRRARMREAREAVERSRDAAEHDIQIAMLIDDLTELGFLA